MARRITFLLFVLLGATWSLVTIHPTESYAKGLTTATPAHEVLTAVRGTQPLPACTHEDGAGQMLCYWDADTQGNGMGNDVVAGDCAVGSTGITSHTISAWCVRVWNIEAYETEHDSWNGPGMVRECVDIEWDAQIDVESRAILDSDGWTLTECFKVMAENS